MGCDIHSYSETLIDGEWVADEKETYKNDYARDPAENGWFRMDEVYGRRNYWLFGVLNRVRTEFSFSFPYSTEFPDDASPEVKQLFEQWDSDAHSPGCHTLAALKQKATKLLLSNEDAAQTCAGYLKEVINAFPESDAKDEDRRMVFWFDN